MPHPPSSDKLNLAVGYLTWGQRGYKLMYFVKGSSTFIFDEAVWAPLSNLGLAIHFALNGDNLD